MSVLSGIVGPRASGDGTNPSIRLDRSAAMAIKAITGKYAEAVLRGNCYFAMIPPSTGQAPGTALGTTAHLALANPAGSGKRLRVLGVSSGYISGTLGAGSMYVVCNTTSGQALPTGGSTIAPVNALITTANASVAKVTFGSTLPASPTALECLFSLFAELATTANGLQVVYFDLDGKYMIDQSGILALEAVAAAGSTPLLSSGFFWEEVTIGQE